MRYWKLSIVCAMAILITAVTVRPAAAEDDDDIIATVSFGVGLNTAQPGNPVNHHILPQRIRIKTGGVVNFMVAGFHQIFAYKPGTRRRDIDGGTSFSSMTPRTCYTWESIRQAVRRPAHPPRPIPPMPRIVWSRWLFWSQEPTW